MNRLTSAFFLAGSLTAFLLPMASHASTPQAGKTLQIYFVDVEGGQATLFVTPAGQSLLIDTGWPGHDGRDADRIVAAAGKAGISKINFVLLTHFHQDHAGGITQLATKIPIGTITRGQECHHVATNRWRFYSYPCLKADPVSAPLAPAEINIPRSQEAEMQPRLRTLPRRNASLGRYTR